MQSIPDEFAEERIGDEERRDKYVCQVTWGGCQLFPNHDLEQSGGTCCHLRQKCHDASQGAICELDYGAMWGK